MTEIQSELTPSQAYAILALFGVQNSLTALRFEQSNETEQSAMNLIGPVIMTDYPGYWCATRATCTVQRDPICIGGNCASVP